MEVRIYRIPREKYADVKKVLEGEDDAFRRVGYILREGTYLGEDDNYYLYIKAPENFFQEHEKKIDAERLTGEDYERIKTKIEKEEEDKAAGIGAIFG